MFQPSPQLLTAQETNPEQSKEVEGVDFQFYRTLHRYASLRSFSI